MGKGGRRTGPVGPGNDLRLWAGLCWGEWEAAVGGEQGTAEGQETGQSLGTELAAGRWSRH